MRVENDEVKYQVLVVDDSQMSLHLLERLLKPYQSFEIAFCQSGVEAVDYLKENDVDILILDIMMPYVSGIDILMKMNEGEFGKHIPTICVSALIDSNIKQQALNYGADEWISKPLYKNIFDDAIESIMTKYLNKC